MKLRVAVQAKGRLFEDTMSLLHETGVKLESAKRLLLVSATNFPLEVLFLRDDDIPQAVADGVADIGIVGENEFVEKRKNALIAKALGFSKCRLSLAVPKGSAYTGVQWFNGKTIATSYPNILEDFLKKNQVQSEIHLITGSVEIAPGIGIADAIFDLVSSGSTLITNHLEEVEVVMKSEAILIQNPKLPQEKLTILDELLFRIEAVLMADDKKYVLMNVPTANIKQIIKVLPGMKSPTVLALAKEEWSSLHAVISEKEFWNIIGQLKELGAEGILVVPIEKMIL